MAIHRNLIEGTAQILKEIFLLQQSAESIIQQHIQSNKKWGSRDRKTVQTAVYTILRHSILLKEICQSDDFFIIAERFMNHPEIIDNTTNQFPFPIQYSIPDALDAIGRKSLGAIRWEKEMKAMHRAGNIYLRIHHYEKNIKAITRELEEKEIHFQIVPYAFTTHKGQKISFTTIQLFNNISLKDFNAYQKGWVDIQDPGSQAIAFFASPENGQLIVDGCCGNGGKSTGMMLIAPQAKYYCMDVNEYKLKQLSQRLNRLQLKQASIQLAEPAQFLSLREKADLLLLDVPCSGSGTIKRQAELKYKINQESLIKTIATQKSIVENQFIQVKKGGKLIYSTCSIFKEENIEVMESFVSNHPSFELMDYMHIYPSEQDTDGFFMASFKRN